MRTYHLLRRVWGPAPSTRDSIVMMVMIAALVTILAIAQVGKRHQVVRAGYELSRETQRLEELRARNRELAVELATLTHPERLRELAEKLGMVPAQPDQIRVVKVSPPDRAPSRSASVEGLPASAPARRSTEAARQAPRRLAVAQETTP